MNTDQISELLLDISEMKKEKVGTSQILAYVQRILQKSLKSGKATAGKAATAKK